MLAPSPAYPPQKFNIQHSTFNIQKNESEHLENNSADSHQHSDRYRYYARSNELHGIKMKIDRSPHYEESGHFRSTENSGHEGSKSLRVIIIFNPPKRVRSLRSRSLRSLRISVFQKSLNIPLSYKIRLNRVRPANKIHPYNQLSEYFFVFLQIYCKNVGGWAWLILLD